ncbi:MAG: haloacid dehalogenase type II [Pseudomonadota bacterium]
MPVSVCVFDAYGTLFDVAAAAREAATEPGRGAFSERWVELAEIWRQKQLQYSWLRAASGIHTDFWQVTQNGLDFALEATGLADDALRARLLQLYWELSAFPEVPETLDRLRADGRNTAILSNASPGMLTAAVRSAGLDSRLDAWLSAESVGVFKPDFANYALVTEHFGVARRAVLFVSSNGWDAWAATAFGFHTVWVNRKGEPTDRLTTPPDHILQDLTAVPEIAKAL